MHVSFERDHLILYIFSCCMHEDISVNYIIMKNAYVDYSKENFSYEWMILLFNAKLPPPGTLHGRPGRGRGYQV